jgi:bifunctional UDP-N-acetylglucosamine pyrophosphorylase/glucosamine-1-phosphate N-acetyltransferase
VEIHNKTLIEYVLSSLPEKVNEVIIVTGYLGEKIKEYLGEEFRGKEIKYVKQKEQKGTGHALWQCLDLLRGKFLVLNSDDIHKKENLEKAAQKENCILVKKIFGEFSGGKVVLDKNDKLVSIIEGNHNEKEALLNCGVYVLQKEFFRYDLVPIKKGEEYGLPQTIVKMSEDIPVEVSCTDYFFGVNSLEDLEKTQKEILL